MSFDLSSLLKDVSNLDTGREQIEYIPLELIKEDPNNFYLLSGVEDLAANISLCGLQQPIRVRKHPTEEGQYMIVSGHRRRAAVSLLAQDDPERWQEVPCIIEQDEVSPALQQLRLIYANSNTRTMTSAEQGEQVEQVTKLLYQLKEEGYDFPGRMRDHVAEAVNISKTKLARLKVIREKLASCWSDAYKNDVLTESQAYAMAQMPKSWQSLIHENWGYGIKSLNVDTITRFRDRFQAITKIQCVHSLSLCEHSVHMMEKTCTVDSYNPCTGCCFDCDNLQTCKKCCSHAVSKQKELKAVAKKATFDAKREQEERDRPGAEFARLVWQRIGMARKVSGVSVKEIVFARGESFYNPSYDDSKQEKNESGEGRYGPNETVSFGYDIRACDMMKVVAVADALHCSVDYLLGRTEQIQVATRQAEIPDCGCVWQTGEPTQIGFYAVVSMYDDCSSPDLHKMMWTGYGWKCGNYEYDPDVDGKILGWLPMPEVNNES